MKKIFYTIAVVMFLFVGMGLVNADTGPTISGNNTVKVGEKINLTASFPNSCLGKEEKDMACAQVIVDVTSEVNWASNNEDILVVEQNGIVTGVKEGKAVVTATYTHDDGTKVSRNYNIEVTKSNPTSYENIMILVLFSDDNGQYDEVSNETWNLGKVGNITKLRPKLCDLTNLKNDNTYDESLCQSIDVTYKSNNEVVKIDENGTIENLKEGTDTIVVTSKEEITINTYPAIKKTPSVSLKVKVSNEKEENKEVEKEKEISAPNTASPGSIIAIVISAALFIFAGIYYFTVINKLKTWKTK